MHYTISYSLAQAHAADLRGHAQRACLARRAGHARAATRGRAAIGGRNATGGRTAIQGRTAAAVSVARRARAARRTRPGPRADGVPGPSGHRVRHRPSPRTVLAIASLGAAVAFVDATIVNIAFPDIARSFPTASTSTLSWVFNAYNIVLAAFLIAAAGIADLLGRRRVFVFGLELFTAGSLLCAIAPSAGALIAFRVVQALGAACLVPSALALVLQAFPAAHRSHGVALLSAVGAAAAGLGPSLGGLLVTAANWRLVFLVNVPIGVTAALLARRWLAESRAPGRRRIPDLAGTLLFAIAIGALVLGVVKGQEWAWGSARVIGCLTAALALGAVVIWRCRRHRAPVLDLSLLRIRTLCAANAMTVIGAAGFYGYTLSNVLFLTGVWRYSILRAGLALTVGPLVAVMVAAPTSKLAQRIGARPVLVAGGLLWGGGVMWLVERVGTTPDFTGQWLPGMALLGVGAGTLFPNLSGAAVASAPGRSFATATGLNAVARQVGAALGIAVVVAIIGTPSAATAGPVIRHAWVFGAVCLFVAGLGCLLAGRTSTAETLAQGDAAPRDAARRDADRREAPPRDAGVVLAQTAAVRARRLPSPRPRRAIALDTADSPGLPGPAPQESALRAESAAEFLARTPLFSGVDPQIVGQLAAKSRTCHLAPGKWLFRERDPADEMFVLRAGRLEVVDEGADAMIREYRRGDALGELALLTDSPRSASVRASRASEVIAVGRADFTEALRRSPALSSALNRSLSRRLQDTRASASTARPRPATVALVVVDGRTRPWRLGARLGAALEAQLPVAVLSGAEVPDAAAADEPAGVYGPLLDRAEAGHDLVLLVGGLALDEPWTRFCLQHADRILAVTGGGPVPPTLCSYPELRGCDLVAYGAAPGTLDGWAAMLDPAESHLIREAELGADLARIARRLAGTSVGIVLSGGGARAFSHIGVLEELTAAGVTIDRIAGVSMGAVIGAMFAMGHDADEIDAICFEEWVRRRPLRDVTLPRHSLIRGARFRSMLHRTFGTRLIEELPLSFFCGSAELRSRRLKITRHGPLWEAVGLSINLPVLVPPEVRGRDIIVDGSLIDNLPVKAMADMAEGPIIAVDVKAAPWRRETGPEGARAGDGRPPRLPSLGETLARLLLLGSENTSVAVQRHADMVIKPRAVGVGLLEFEQLDAARAAGRAAAREALEALEAPDQAPPAPAANQRGNHDGHDRLRTQPAGRRPAGRHPAGRRGDLQQAV
jgi:NTE family protein